MKPCPALHEKILFFRLHDAKWANGAARAELSHDIFKPNAYCERISSNQEAAFNQCTKFRFFHYLENYEFYDRRRKLRLINSGDVEMSSFNPID